MPELTQSGLSLCRLKADEWDLLPPLPDIIEAVHLFTRNYFQLGFIPKELFPRQLEQDHRSVSVFLLLAILSICSDAELNESDSEEEVNSMEDLAARKQLIKSKILAVGRMQKVFQLLRSVILRLSF